MGVDRSGIKLDNLCIKKKKTVALAKDGIVLHVHVNNCINGVTFFFACGYACNVDLWTVFNNTGTSHNHFVQTPSMVDGSLCS